MADDFTVTPATPPRLPGSAPQPELLRALGRLVRGLSAIFWGLPIALIIGVQTARGDWLEPLGVFPPLAAAGMLLYGLSLLGSFQKQERIWLQALDRAKLFAVVNLGLAPFLYWWHHLPMNPFFNSMIELLCLASLLFLFTLNPVLWRLAAMLPDETLRLETKLFTTLNRCLLVVSMTLLLGHFLLERAQQVPPSLLSVLLRLEKGGLWVLVFLTLMPFAMTMALIWKIKEVILVSVFGKG